MALMADSNVSLVSDEFTLDETLGRTIIYDSIPHRPPFLLVDKVTRLVPGKSIEGLQEISIQDPYLIGRGSGNCYYPNFLIIESASQLGAVLINHELKGTGKIPVVAGMDGVEFFQTVRPGDRLHLKVELLKFRGNVGKAVGTGYVNGVLVGQGNFIFGLTDSAQ